MSKHRTKPKTDPWNCWETKLPKGPNGRNLCRQCHEEVGKGRRTFCSDECVHQWRITTDIGYARGLVYKRDKGVCSICGLDTVALQKQFLAELKDRQQQRIPWTQWKQERLKELQIPCHRTSGDWWDMDHTLPVAEGGGEATLDNLRTLCVPCHHKVTAELRARLKQKKGEVNGNPQLRLMDE